MIDRTRKDTYLYINQLRGFHCNAVYYLPHLLIQQRKPNIKYKLINKLSSHPSTVMPSTISCIRSYNGVSQA